MTLNGLDDPVSILSLRAPLYYGQFVWSQKCQKSYIPYLYTCNTDTSVKWTLGSVPLVSVLKRFDCAANSTNSEKPKENLFGLKYQ